MCTLKYTQIHTCVLIYCNHVKLHQRLPVDLKPYKFLKKTQLMRELNSLLEFECI